MRLLATIVPLALIAAPAAAQTAPRSDDFQIPPELTDPAMGETLARMLGAMSRAMMDMPVGEMQAAVEGRQPTIADKRRTLRDVAGGGRDFDRKIEQQVAIAMPRMQATMKAMAGSMPAMARALEQAAEGMEREIDRATANLPDPTYPKR